MGVLVLLLFFMLIERKIRMQSIMVPKSSMGELTITNQYFSESKAKNEIKSVP